MTDLKQLEDKLGDMVSQYKGEDICVRAADMLDIVSAIRELQAVLAQIGAAAKECSEELTRG